MFDNLWSEKPKMAKKKESVETEAPGIFDHLWGGIKVLSLVILMPPMLNYAGLQKEKEFFRGAAVLFDIGFGQKMYINCTGTGSPTLILDAPTGRSSDVFLKLQSTLASLGTVCIYDRAGLGLSDVAVGLNASDPGEAAVLNALGPETTAVRMVSDLHRLITFARPLQRPLVLVGSELGAAVVRGYAHLHPEDVGGLVLIDPAHPSLFNHGPSDEDNPWIDHWHSHLIFSFRLLQLSALMGLNRLGLLAGQLSLPNFSECETVIAKQKHEICDGFHIQAAIDEHRSMNVSLRQVEEIAGKWPLPPSIHTTVISGDKFDGDLTSELNDLWSKAMHTLIQRIPGSNHVVIPGGDRHTLHQNTDAISAVIMKFVSGLSLELADEEK